MERLESIWRIVYVPILREVTVLRWCRSIIHSRIEQLGNFSFVKKPWGDRVKSIFPIPLLDKLKNVFLSLWKLSVMFSQRFMSFVQRMPRWVYELVSLKILFPIFHSLLLLHLSLKTRSLFFAVLYVPFWHILIKACIYKFIDSFLTFEMMTISSAEVGHAHTMLWIL
jgi:hypothetical protein